MRYVSVYPNGDRPCWYVAFPDPKSGKRVARVSEFRRDDPAGKRKALNWARELAGEALLDNRTPGAWSNWVDTYLRLKYRNSPKTLRCELIWWGWCETFLRERKVSSPRGVTYQLGLDYIAWRTSQVKRVSGRSPSFNSALQEVKALSRLMREAIRRGFAESNPLAGMGLKRDPAPEKPEISDEEVAIIRARLAEIEGGKPWRKRWMSVAFEIALHQGCRHNETRIALADIDEVKGTVLFHVKRGRVFTTQLHPELRPLIARLRAEGARHTLEFPPRKVAFAWWRFFREEVKLPHLCFHCTRVTVITRMARAGVPIQQAMAFVLHADELIHKVYQRLQPDDVGRCVAALAYPKRQDGAW